MKKLIVIALLLSFYTAYSFWVYKQGTENGAVMTTDAIKGKALWQVYNCQNCHQIFGLGGYMGPDLTTVTTDVRRGEAYTKAMILNGGNRMPNFHFNDTEAEQLTAWLSYVNNVATNNN